MAVNAAQGTDLELKVNKLRKVKAPGKKDKESKTEVGKHAIWISEPGHNHFIVSGIMNRIYHNHGRNQAEGQTLWQLKACHRIVSTGQLH